MSEVLSLKHSQEQLPSLMISLGTAADQIREAIADADGENLLGATIVCDDVLCTLAEMEQQVSDLAGFIARWKLWAETKEGRANP
jgi:hypothetical protein